MKNLKYIALLLGLMIHFQSSCSTQINIHELTAIKKNSTHRLALSLALGCFLIFYNQKTVQSAYKNYPVLSFCASCITAKFITDLYAQYKKINGDLFLLKLVSKIYCYIKSAFLVEPDEKKCFDLIEKYSGFSIEIIQEITQKVFYQSLKCINCTPVTNVDYECPCIQKPNLEMLNIDDIANEFKNYPDIYQELLLIHKNSHIDKEKFFKIIGKKIKKDMTILINK